MFGLLRVFPKQRKTEPDFQSRPSSFPIQRASNNSTRKITRGKHKFFQHPQSESNPFASNLNWEQFPTQANPVEMATPRRTIIKQLWPQIRDGEIPHLASKEANVDIINKANSLGRGLSTKTMIDAVLPQYAGKIARYEGKMPQRKYLHMKSLQNIQSCPQRFNQ